MYAIVRCGGRQEKASVDDVLTVDKLAGEVGSTRDAARRAGRRRRQGDQRPGGARRLRGHRRDPRAGHRPQDQHDPLQEQDRLPAPPGPPAEVHAGEDHRHRHASKASAARRRRAEMAHKKGASSSRNGRDSNAQRLGVKRFGGQLVAPARSSCASAARTSTPVPASAAAATTPCSPWCAGKVEFGTRRGRRAVSMVPVDELPADASAERRGYLDRGRSRLSRLTCGCRCRGDWRGEFADQAELRVQRGQRRPRLRLGPPGEVQAARRARRRQRRPRRRRDPRGRPERGDAARLPPAGRSARPATASRAQGATAAAPTAPTWWCTVPDGTVVKTADGEVLADLIGAGTKYVAAAGRPRRPGQRRARLHQAQGARLRAARRARGRAGSWCWS